MKGFYVTSRSGKPFFQGGKIHKEKKKWGEEHWIVNKEYCGKKLVLLKNFQCSMHSHKEKDEVFYLQSGKAVLEIGKKKYTLRPGDFVHIPPNTPHRFTGLLDSEIFEFSTTHDEADSFRTTLSGHVDQKRYDRETAIIDRFRKVSVLVVGDVMLDTYIAGVVSRVSPEAPIPIVHHSHEHQIAGGAANVACNVVSLGGRCVLVGVRGGDSSGGVLEKLLKKSGVHAHLLKDRSRRTTEKQRVVGNSSQQIVRLDFEDTHALDSKLQKSLLSKVKAALRHADVLVLSDYAKGVFSKDMLKAIIALAAKRKVPVILDPKPTSAEYVRSAKGVTLFTPNRKEAHLLTGMDGDAAGMARELSKMLRTHVLLTLGADGMLLSSPRGKQTAFPALAREVADVSGAGDTVIATAGLVIGCGGSFEDAVDLSNRAASIVVGKKGTATITVDELKGVL